MLNIKRKLSQRGFSLIELMIAVTILAMAIFGIFHAYSVGFLGMADTRDRTVATNHVQEKMEELKNADFDTVVDEASSQIVGDIKFIRNVNVEYIDGSTNLIVSGPTNLKRVITTVNWTDRNGVTKKVKSSLLLQNTQYTPGDASRISLYADPYNVVLPVTSSTTIIAVIKDNSGNNIFDWDGSDVTFTIISGDLLGTLSDYAVTPVQGRASVIMTSSGTDPEEALVGTMIIEASVTTVDGLNTFTDTIDIDVTWGAVKIELIADPSSIYADGESTSTIIAILENAAGGRVIEDLSDITFTVVGEGILLGSTTKPATETYNGDDGGVATILLQSKTTPGIVTVTAESTGLFSGSCDVRTSGEPAGITLSASPNPMYSDDISKVTVTIVDENGVPVIPATTMTVGFTLSGSGILSDDSLDFDTVSVRTLNYTYPSNTEETVTITATSGSFTEDINISVELKLDAHHIELNANPPNILADGGDSFSTITATIKNEDDLTVHNYNGSVNFSILTALGGALPIFGINTVDCDNGVATIELKSGEQGICVIQAESGTLPVATIDVGFYSTATHILLTAVPNHIPVGGGNEGTSILTATIKDKDVGGTTVYNYSGKVLFSFLNGFNSTAKFKFVSNQSYSVPVFHGSASVYILSLNNSGDAGIKAEDETFGLLTLDELTLYIQKVLRREPTIPNVEYDTNGKSVDFDIEVLGGDMQINKMNVSWSPNSDENQLISIEFPNGEVFSGSIPSGQDIDITDIDITDRVLLEGTSTIHLGFLAGITDQDITVIFYPSATDDYADNSYEISF